MRSGRSVEPGFQSQPTLIWVSSIRQRLPTAHATHRRTQQDHVQISGFINFLPPIFTAALHRDRTAESWAYSAPAYVKPASPIMKSFRIADDKCRSVR